MDIQPTSQSWTLSDNSAFTVTSKKVGDGYDTWGNVWQSFSYTLTAQKTGTYTFTVKLYNPGWTQTTGDEHTSIVIYTIKVNSSGGGGTNYQVTSISFNETNYNLCVGGQKQLTAIISPSNATNKALTWSSNDENIATVDSSGLVTAESTGTAVITATTTDGSNLSASCAFNVKPAPSEVTIN